MGVRIIVEIWDHWKGAGLTAGERGDLQLIAEKADDVTRETVGPVHEPYILERAGKSAGGWKNAIGKLMKKGVLEYAVRNGRPLTGHSGQNAVYRVPVLCPEPPHDGWRGYCTRPERVTSQVTQSTEERPEKGHLSGDPIQGKGHLSGGKGSPLRWERVTSQVTPIPNSPTTPPPPSRPPAEPSAPAEPASGREGGRQLTPEEQKAADTLTHAIAAEPRLALGEAELVSLLPLVTPWLDRATPDHLRQALTAGLPATVDSPVGLLRRRLTRKLPAARRQEPQTDTAEAKCGECDANGLRYHDPEDQLGPYRCPCRTSQPDAT